MTKEDKLVRAAAVTNPVSQPVENAAANNASSRNEIRGRIMADSLILPVIIGSSVGRLENGRSAPGRIVHRKGRRDRRGAEEQRITGEGVGLHVPGNACRVPARRAAPHGPLFVGITGSTERHTPRLRLGRSAKGVAHFTIAAQSRRWT